MKKQLPANYKVPFINTTVATDLMLLFSLLPLWWVLGIDQLIWPLMTAWIFIKLLYTSGHNITLTTTSRFMIAMAIVAPVSACFIDESYRILTFARNYSAMISVLLMIISVTNGVNHEKQARSLMWGLAIMSFFISLAGTLAITHLFNPQFEALSKYLIPESLKSYGLVRSLYIKSTSTIDYFAGMLIVRPNSFFISCTSYGMVLIILLPAVYFLTVTSRGLKKLFLILTLAMLTVNMFFNITRGAMLSLAIAIIINVFKKFKSFNRIFITLIFLFTVSVMSLYPAYFYELKDSIQGMVNLRGPGSQESRKNIYLATLKGVAERPIFGYGTQRDIPETSPYPVGSHSGYLGILYRYGIAGFLFYAVILLTIYKNTKLPKAGNNASPFLKNGINYLSIAFYGIILHQITEEPDLDSSVLHIVWLAFGLLLVINKLAATQENRKNAEN